MQGYLYDNHIPELQKFDFQQIFNRKIWSCFNTYNLILYDYLYLNSHVCSIPHFANAKTFFSDLNSWSQSCHDIVAL
jgi:hypothetical protein